MIWKAPYVIAGVALLLVAVYAWGQNDGRSAMRAKIEQERLEAIEGRERVEDEVSDRDDGDLVDGILHQPD